MKKTVTISVVSVTARCVLCRATRQVLAGEVRSGDLPMCHKCASPMVATGAASQQVEMFGGKR